MNFKKIKNWLTGIILVGSPTASAQVLPNTSSESNTNDTVVEVVDTINPIKPVIKDIIPADSLLTDSISNDSIRYAKGLANFASAESKMLHLIAHSEGVRVKAYWDKYGKVWTIGIGNTIRPDGKKVGRFDVIRSEKELLDYFHVHINGDMKEKMSKYLPLDKMNEAQIASIVSFLYNCGHNLICTPSGEPSKFAKDITKWIETGDEQAKKDIKSYMFRRIRSNGRVLPQLEKRRDLETRILFGDIELDDSSKPNYLDLSKVALGGMYSIGNTIRKDSIKVVEMLSEVKGKRLTDSINGQFKNRGNEISKAYRKYGGRE